MAKQSKSESLDARSDRMERIFDSMNIDNPFSRSQFLRLLKELREVMDFDFIPPEEIALTVKELSANTKRNMLNINKLTLEQITGYMGWLNQIHYFLSEKQAEAEARAIQLNECSKMQKAGVTFALSKHGRTLADRIAKGVTNQDKEAVGTMVTTQEAQSELAWYHLSTLLKNLMRNISMQQSALGYRYNKLYSEWKIEKERVERGGA